MIALIRKEFREKWLVAAILTSLVIFSYFAVGMFPGASQDTKSMALIVVMGFGLTVLGALTFAEERRARTNEFLSTLPMTRIRRAFAKMFAGFALSALFVAVVLGILFCFSAPHELSLYPTFSIGSSLSGLLLLGLVIWTGSLLASSLTASSVSALLISWVLAPGIVLLFVYTVRVWGDLLSVYTIGFRGGPATAGGLIFKIEQALLPLAAFPVLIAALFFEVKGERYGWSTALKVGLVAVLGVCLALADRLENERLMYWITCLADRPQVIGAAASPRTVVWAGGRLRIYEPARGWRRLEGQVLSAQSSFRSQRCPVDPSGRYMVVRRAPRGFERIPSFFESVWSSPLGCLNLRSQRAEIIDQRFRLSILNLISGSVSDLGTNPPVPDIEFVGWTPQGELLLCIAQRSDTQIRWDLWTFRPADGSVVQKRLDVPLEVQKMVPMTLRTWRTPVLEGDVLVFCTTNSRTSWNTTTGEVHIEKGSNWSARGFSPQGDWQLSVQSPYQPGTSSDQGSGLIGLLFGKGEGKPGEQTGKVVACKGTSEVVLAEFDPAAQNHAEFAFLDDHTVLFHLREAIFYFYKGLPIKSLEGLRLYQDLDAYGNPQKYWAKAVLVRVNLETGQRQSLDIDPTFDLLFLSPLKSRLLLQRRRTLPTPAGLPRRFDWRYDVTFVDTLSAKVIGNSADNAKQPFISNSSAWWDEDSIANWGVWTENGKFGVGLEIADYATGETERIPIK